VAPVAAAEDPYLVAAFADQALNPPPSPGPDQKVILRKILADLKGAAQKKRFYKLEDKIAAGLGEQGYLSLSPLLRHPDPWVRGLGAQALFSLDRRRAVPFLIGLLKDDGAFSRTGDISEMTVSDAAKTLLKFVFHGDEDCRVPPDEAGLAGTKEAAMQRWYAYHHAYYEWRGSRRAGKFYPNGRALVLSIPSDTLARRVMEDPRRFKEVLTVFPMDNGTGIFRAGGPVPLGLQFRNFGTQQLWLRWDKSNSRIHVLRLFGPDQKEVPPAPGAVEPLPKDVGDLQPLGGDGSPLGWNIDLQKIFHIAQPGRYKLYYAYKAPESRDPKETDRHVGLTFWDGRRYVNYYEFYLR